MGLLRHQGLCALLALAAAEAHETLARQLYSQEKAHIWGTCGPVVSSYGVPACVLSDAVCSDGISEGPAHADLEVVLGNLPRSTAEEEVHVAWWAAYESPRTWKPLVSPTNVSIYPNMDMAYPKWDAVEFNGGNVLVNSLGQATIRVRTMATYLDQQHVVRPHIHLRVCRGAATVLEFDHLSFGTGRQWVETHSQGENIRVLSIQHIDNPGAPPTDYSVPWVDPALERALVAAAREIDPAALDASAIFQCLSTNQHYSHFSRSCVAACPAGTKDLEGECIKGDYTGIVVTFEESWGVEIQCSGACPTIDANLLHTVEIAVANYLKLSYRDVEVAIAWLRALGRRLSDETGPNTLIVTVKVRIARYDRESGAALLQQMMPSTMVASAILGLEVLSISETSEDAFDVEVPSEPTSKESSDEWFDIIADNKVVLIACGGAVVAAMFLVWALRKFRRHRKHERKMAEKRAAARAAAQRRAMSFQQELEHGNRRIPEELHEIPEHA